jgi:hypothetical protein
MKVFLLLVSPNYHPVERKKMKWFFGIELRILLKRPNHAKVCSQIIKFASGYLAVTFAGAYTTWHSGLLI